jgi:hypothetical protein
VCLRHPAGPGSLPAPQSAGFLHQLQFLRQDSHLPLPVPMRDFCFLFSTFSF